MYLARGYPDSTRRKVCCQEQQEQAAQQAQGSWQPGAPEDSEVGQAVPSTAEQVH